MSIKDLFLSGTSISSLIGLIFVSVRPQSNFVQIEGRLNQSDSFRQDYQRTEELESLPSIKQQQHLLLEGKEFKAIIVD